MAAGDGVRGAGPFFVAGASRRTGLTLVSRERGAGRVASQDDVPGSVRPSRADLRRIA